MVPLVLTGLVSQAVPDTVRLVVEALTIMVLFPTGLTEKILFELLSITWRPLAVWSAMVLIVKLGLVVLADPLLM